MKLDLHIHTCYSKTRRWGSSSLIEPEQLLDKIVALGLDGLAVTDHDQIDGSLYVAELAPKWGVIAVPGIEVSSSDGHILALGVTRMVPPSLPAEETIELIHEQGGIAVAAHPLNIVVSLRKRDLVALPFDALETHNPRSLRNRSVSRLSRKLGTGRTGGSDAHAINQVGTGITEIPFECHSYADVINAVRCKHSTAHGTCTPYRDLARDCLVTAAVQKKDKIKTRLCTVFGLPAA